MGRIRKVRVFYSWQSDSRRKQTATQFVRPEIASQRIEGVRSDLRILPDEATLGTSGSPNIALKILEKIEAADISVADVTTITSPGAQRPCPNPNVGYELGYAVSQLGWNRVILLFNGGIRRFSKGPSLRPGTAEGQPL
jgi:hypothetical protein